MTTTITLIGKSQREYAMRCIAEAPQGYVVRIDEPKRSDEQNRALWPRLKDISEQVEWHGNKLADHEWKDLFTAALKQQKVVPGIEGGLVFIGGRTSTMKVREFSDLLEIINEFGARHGVIWSEERAA